MSCHIWQSFRATVGGQRRQVCERCSVRCRQSQWLSMAIMWSIKNTKASMGCTYRWTIFELSFGNSEGLIKSQSTHLLMVNACTTLHGTLSHWGTEQRSHSGLHFPPPVALKGSPDITTRLKGKWHILSFQITTNFLIKCANVL